MAFLFSKTLRECSKRMSGAQNLAVFLKMLSKMFDFWAIIRYNIKYNLVCCKTRVLPNKYYYIKGVIK